MSRYGTLVEVDADTKPVRVHRPATLEEWADLVERRARWSIQWLAEHPDYDREEADAEFPHTERVLTADDLRCELSTVADEDAAERWWAEYCDGILTLYRAGILLAEESRPARPDPDHTAGRLYGRLPVGGWRGENPSILVLDLGRGT